MSGRRLCGGTVLWDAVYETAHLKLSRFNGSRALLILSDGNDTGSIHHFEQTLAEVHRTGALAYAIRYPDPLTGAGDTGLSQLAADTGAAEFAAAPDYAGVFETIERDLRSQYVLGFHPEAGALGLFMSSAW